jgi:hypothetical protein
MIEVLYLLMRANVDRIISSFYGYLLRDFHSLIYILLNAFSVIICQIEIFSGFIFSRIGEDRVIGVIVSVGILCEGFIVI